MLKEIIIVIIIIRRIKVKKINKKNIEVIVIISKNKNLISWVASHVTFHLILRARH